MTILQGENARFVDVKQFTGKTKTGSCTRFAGMDTTQSWGAKTVSAQTPKLPAVITGTMEFCIYTR